MKPLIQITIILIFLIHNKLSEAQNIQDIWVGDYELNTYWDYESSKNDLPLLIDLRSSNEAKILHFGNGLKISTWNLTDSILTIDSIKYRLINISLDSLVYSSNIEKLKKPIEKDFEEEIYAVPIKENYFVFKRIRKIDLQKTDSTTRKIIENKIWIRETNYNNDSIHHGDWFEFLDNGIAILKMNSREINRMELLSECWNIESYENYLFLVFNSNHVYKKGFQGILKCAFQFTKIDSNRISFNNFIHSEKVSFNLSSSNENNIIEKKLYGKWFSKNRSNEFYAIRYSERAVQNGDLCLFSDTLFYDLKENNLLITPNGFDSISCNWRINSDGTIFLVEYKITYESYTRYYVEYSNFKLESDSSFKLELFENAIYTELEKPNTILFNKFQNLNKIE